MSKRRKAIDHAYQVALARHVSAGKTPEVRVLLLDLWAETYRALNWDPAERGPSALLMHVLGGGGGLEENRDLLAPSGGRIKPKRRKP